MRADKDLYSANDIRRMAMMKHPEDRTSYEKWCVFVWKLKQVVGTIGLIGIAIMWYRSEHPSHDQPVKPAHHSRSHK